MSEKTVQEGIQEAIRAMTEFSDGDVTINDWSVLDQSNANAPYIIIKTADTFTSRQDSKTESNRWDIIMILCEPFQQYDGGWQPTLDNLRDRRQAIVDKLRNALRSPDDGSLSVTIDVIRSDSGIIPEYDVYVTKENIDEAIPIFLCQSIVAECEEY